MLDAHYENEDGVPHRSPGQDNSQRELTGNGGPHHSADQSAERTEMEWNRARAGSVAYERKLFLKLWQFCIKRVRAHSYWPALKGHMEPADVVQNLWELLFRRGSMLNFEDRGSGSMRTWLAACLDHHMVDLVRRQKAEKRGGGRSCRSIHGESSSAPGITPASPLPGASTVVAFGDWRERCRQVLTRREYAVWNLRVNEDLGYPAIGEALQITSSAARSLCRRARQRLAEQGLLGSGDDAVQC